MPAESEHGVDLHWLPLGAGGHSVRLNGRVFEAVAARLGRRPTCDLYHSALQVRVPEGRFVIEQAPVRDSNGGERGVVAEGAVGSRWAGRFRIFRYEVRCWRGGVIPDLGEAAESPQRLTDDPDLAQRVLDLTPHAPTAVWGRDELAAGEMWNSNSVISWLIASSGLDAGTIHPPAGGRAPGWHAGLVVARRQGTLPYLVGRASVVGGTAAPASNLEVTPGLRRGFSAVSFRRRPEATRAGESVGSGGQGGTSVDTDPVRHLADRNVVGDNESLTFDPVNSWARNTDPGDRARPQQAARTTAGPDATRRMN